MQLQVCPLTLSETIMARGREWSAPQHKGGLCVSAMDPQAHDEESVGTTLARPEPQQASHGPTAALSCCEISHTGRAKIMRSRSHRASLRSARALRLDLHMAQPRQTANSRWNGAARSVDNDNSRLRERSQPLAPDKAGKSCMVDPQGA